MTWMETFGLFDDAGRAPRQLRQLPRVLRRLPSAASFCYGPPGGGITLRKDLR